MRKKICIATPVDYGNFGNRLQNYAVHMICKKMGMEPVTLAVEYSFVCGKIPKHRILELIHTFHIGNLISKANRLKSINKSYASWLFTKETIKTVYVENQDELNRMLTQSAYFGIGGDQIFASYWNEIVWFSMFPECDPNSKICFSPSFGTDSPDRDYLNKIKPELLEIFVPHMWYYSIAAICAGGVTIALQYVFTKKLIPEITIKKEYYNPKRILEILKSGVWLSLESLNKMLQTGLDLLVTNLFVNASAMGLFSIAKQIPVILAQIPQLIANVFNPELAKLYAENKQEELIEKFKFTIRFLSFMMIVPLIGFVVFGKEFYTLWLGNKTINEINTIQILSILTVLPLLVNAYVEGLYYANTLANKIKGSVIITTIFSVASIGTEFLLLKTTNFNPLIIIAGTSSCYMIVRHAVVTPLYCAYVLKLPKMTFYPALVKSVVISCVIYVLFEGVRRVVVIGSWFKFLFVCAGVGILGYVLVLILLFNKDERKKVLQMVLKRKSK